MSVVPRLQDVLQTIQLAVEGSLNDAGIISPAQVVIGWPIQTQLEAIIESAGYMVSIFPRPGTAEATTRYSVVDSTFTLSSSPLSPLGVSVSNNDTLTFTGFVTPGITVHTFAMVNSDVIYTTVLGDTLSSVASAVAAAITAASISGLAATATGPSVTISGGNRSLICNISSPEPIMAQEVSRIARTIQVSVWTANPQLRFTAADAIETGVGNHTKPILTLSDGTALLCLFSGRSGSDELADGAEAMDGLFAEHIMLAVEYGILRLLPSTEISAVENIVTVDDGSPITLITGGS